MANYLSSDLVAALSSLNVHDFPHFVNMNLINYLTLLNFSAPHAPRTFSGCLKNKRRSPSSVLWDPRSGGIE